MASIRFSVRARADLRDIAAYTVQTWDAAQADRYLARLEGFCERLAAMPVHGRSCDEIRPGLLRAQQASHVVFFRREAVGILVCRVLHKRMLPAAHAIDDEERD